MSELKPCPFCGRKPYESGGYVSCHTEECLANADYHEPAIGSIEHWNTRPIEDELRARIAELEAEVTKCHELQDSYCDRIAQLEKEIARRDEELLELNNKAVFIKFENEDELPAEIKDDVYSAMFECSHVDGVRLFPYIEENGQKYFLVMIEEENKSRLVYDDFVGDSDHEHDDRIL